MSAAELIGRITPVPYVPYVPPVAPTTDNYWQTPSGTLNQVGKRARRQQLSVAGANSVIRVLYGTQRIGAQLAGIRVRSHESLLLLRVVWCYGEVDSCVQLTIDDDPVGVLSGVVHTFYTGAAGQGVDPTLEASYAEDGLIYTDTLPGICYSVVSIPKRASSGFPRMGATIKGKKIATSSGGAKSYQDNWAYVLADFIENTTYGLGKAVNWSDVATLAAACDTDCAGERKRIASLVIDQPQTADTWLQVMRAYAGCWIVPEGETYRLITDEPGSSVMSFDSSNVVQGSLSLTKRSTRQSPTVVQVEYTDTRQRPWKQIPAKPAEAPGVDAGTTPRRYSKVSMPGIQRHSEAYRFAVERLNEALLNDLTVTFQAFDEGLQLQVGDLFDLTHPIGLSAKLFRAMVVAPAGPGRWNITGIEYDAAKYSTEVVAGPSVVDTDWPSPSDPPAIGTLTLAEEVYQLQNGKYSSRIRATWDALDWPFLRHYRITVTSLGAVVDTATIERGAATSYATPAVTELQLYQVTVEVVSSSDAVGDAVAATLTPAGKYLVPGDVPSVTGFEAGGQVFLYWSPAADVDIDRYEIRYGTTGGSWDTATLIDRVDGLTYKATGVPAGTWRFYIKAIDSVRQYSTNAAHIDFAVTLDANAFLLGTKVVEDLGDPVSTSSHVTAYTTRPDARTFYVTDFGDALAQGYTNTNNATGLITDDSLGAVPMASPHSAGTCTFLTPSWDVGQSLTGNWSFVATFTDLAGTATLTVETSPDNSTWTSWAGGSGKTTARYVRGRIESTGAFVVESGATLRIDAYPRTENGIVSVSANPTTITLTNKYAAAKSIQLTPKGTASKQAVYDNVVVSPSSANSFDLYLFDAANNPTTGDVAWQFQGI